MIRERSPASRYSREAAVGSTAIKGDSGQIRRRLCPISHSAKHDVVDHIVASEWSEKEWQITLLGRGHQRASVLQRRLCSEGGQLRHSAAG